MEFSQKETEWLIDHAGLNIKVWLVTMESRNVNRLFTRARVRQDAEGRPFIIFPSENHYFCNIRKMHKDPDQRVTKSDFSKYRKLTEKKHTFGWFIDGRMTPFRHPVTFKKNHAKTDMIVGADLPKDAVFIRAGHGRAGCGGVGTSGYRKHYPAIYASCSGRCHYCNKQVLYADGTLDHMMPRAKGGSDDVKNLTLSCLPCNQDKADMDYNDYMILIEPEI